jgi:hypothetical protein
MLEILDGIIATAAVVLALSLVVQAIQQILKQLFSMKSSYMERELVMMFLSDDALQKLSVKWKSFSSKIIPDWKLFNSILRNDRAIVDQIKLKMQSIGYEDLEVVEKMNGQQLLNIVRSLPMFANQNPDTPGSLKEAIDNVTVWFDITKQAFQDHYERKMKVWALGISAAVVFALNANLFEIYQEFSQNKTLRDAAVTWAEKVVSQPRDSIITIQRVGKADTIVVKQKSDSTAVAAIRKNIEEIRQSVNMNSFHIMRWYKFNWSGAYDFVHIKYLLKAIIGWVCMILLVSLGAPFWYDFLKTVMGVKDKLKQK